MTTEQQEETKQESSGVSADRFAELAEKHGFGAPSEASEPEPLEEAPKEVPKDSEETLDPGTEEVQDSSADHPAPDLEEGLSLAEATMWCRRGGLPDHILKSKSEDEIHVLGQEFSTLKRQDDREFSKRQNREATESPETTASDESQEDVGASTDGDEDNPVDEAVTAEERSALEVELGEEAARIVIQSRQDAADAKRELAEVKSMIEAGQAERQAAAAKVQVDGAMIGLGDDFPDLSKSEDVRQKVIDRAGQLVKADPERYASISEDKRMATVLREAATLELGAPSKRPKPTRTVSAPSTRASGSEEAETGKGEVGRRSFDLLYRKHM